MKRDLTQFNKIEAYLKDKGIKYERIDVEQEYHPEYPTLLTKMERHQIYVPDRKNPKWDVICHYGSYGCEEGLLEIMGCIVSENAGDSVEGFLTADEVIERIERYKE